MQLKITIDLNNNLSEELIFFIIFIQKKIFFASKYIFQRNLSTNRLFLESAGWIIRNY